MSGNVSRRGTQRPGPGTNHAGQGNFKGRSRGQAARNLSPTIGVSHRQVDVDERTVRIAHLERGCFMRLAGWRGLQTHLLRLAGFSVRRFRRAGSQAIGEQCGGRHQQIGASAGGIEDRYQGRRHDSGKANVINEAAVLVERINVLVKSGDKDLQVTVAVGIQNQWRATRLGAEQVSPYVMALNINCVQVAPQSGAQNQR